MNRDVWITVGKYENPADASDRAEEERGLVPDPIRVVKQGNIYLVQAWVGSEE